MTQPIAIPIPRPVIRSSRCENCGHGVLHGVATLKSARVECHRMPPILNLLNTPQGLVEHVTFPKVMPDAWCGEWKTKIEQVN